MFHDADKPEFDTMSQDELIAWLDMLAERQRGEAAESSGGQAAPPAAEKPLAAEQRLEEEDDETPTVLTTLDDGGSDDTTDPLTWFGDMDGEAELGGIAPAAEPGDLDEVSEQLDNLAGEVGRAAGETGGGADAGIVAGGIVQSYEDSEDESLYSQLVGESLPGLGEPVNEAFSTQSMAPLPDFLAEGGSDDRSAPAASRPYDSLTLAFLMQEQQAELEAWYAERLRVVAAAGALGADALKPPPPGLAAGFNMARGKLAAEKIAEALEDYETLLRANIGLDLVVDDMRWLIKQARHRDNPAVHRLLGEALMRQGELQQALDVYRQALKLL